MTRRQTNADKHQCCLINVHNTCISPHHRHIRSWRNRKQILSKAEVPSHSLLDSPFYYVMPIFSFSDLFFNIQLSPGES